MMENDKDPILKKLPEPLFCVMEDEIRRIKFKI